MSQTAWLARRALVAVALMVGFYLLAIGTALVLLWLPYAEVTYMHRIDRFTLFAGLAGLGVLWAIIPRPDRFTPPGPRLEESDQAPLFAMIRDVASATKQDMPTDVYLIGDVNAWVSQRGGVMGFGSRRVMGVGLPLVQALTIGELRGVVAHEFGHYSGGDVALGPWIYKTRGAIVRAIAGMRVTIVTKLFMWYGRLFMKLTLAVSRRQELIADEVAARVAGADVAAAALRRVAGVAFIHSLYLNQEVVPALNAGFLPPIARGFDEFLVADRVQALLPQVTAAAECKLGGDDFDTHPPLAERLAALALQTAAGEPDNRPASVLLNDRDRLARDCFAVANGQEKITALIPIEWDGVGERVHVARWRAIGQHCAAWLSALTPETLPVNRASFLTLVRGLPGLSTNDDDAVIGLGVSVVASALGLMLLRDGWILKTGPGQPFILVRGIQEVRPFDLIAGVVTGTGEDLEWKARCQMLGLAGRPLWDTQQALSGLGSRAVRD